MNAPPTWPRVRRAKKNWPRKKEWKVGRDNDSRSQRPQTAAPGLARGRMGRRAEPAARPGAYALLSRADGQLPGRRSGRNAGAGYDGGATRHPAHLTEEQVAQWVRQQVEASLDPGGPILQLSDKTYLFDPEGHWVVSTQSTRYRNSRTEVETLLRQRMRGLRSVSFQLPCEEGRAAERLQGQAALRAPAAGRAAAAERGGGVRGLRRHAAPRLKAPRHLRRGGARVLRVAQSADACAELAGRPRGQPQSGAEGAPHRASWPSTGTATCTGP